MKGILSGNHILNHFIEELFGSKDANVYNVLDAIFNSMYDGVYITDNKGNTIYVNKSYEDMSGLRREDIIGENMGTLIDKGYFEESASLMVLKQNKRVSIIDKFKNGKRCLITSSPVYDYKGNIVLVITNLRDMSLLYKINEKLKWVEEQNLKYINEIKELRKDNLNKDLIIGNSKEMNLVYDIIDKVADVDATVLILGETGTGKEVIAKEIHRKSLRNKGPFIKVNCAAIPESLFESELFGYEKGAFTGAMNKGKPGFFELADAGTILLDEIGEISLNSQTKLLRVIQEKQMIRLGGIKYKNVDARIIASTNRDLKQLVKSGEFREDLYYRLNIVPITVPPLRERDTDITLFALEFLNIFNKKYSKNKKISHKGFEVLKTYKWPGNVRQLKNIIERIVLICPYEIISDEYILNILDYEKDNEFFIMDENVTLNEAVTKVEREIIFRTLKKYGTTRKAAEALGVSQPTIVRKANKYNIRLGDTNLE